MSKKIIADLFMVIVIVFFLMAFFVVPQLKESMLDVLCMPELITMQKPECIFGPLMIHLIPFFAISWLIIRCFIKITKFASFVDSSPKIQGFFRTLFEKLRFLD
ncbi:MAG: hypothetical protein QXN71_03610 [Candidatus Aenigmatarchaeota archaeon]